jgi:hypothetical protein
MKIMRKFLRWQRVSSQGGMVESIVLAGVGLTVALGIIFLASKFSGSMRLIANQKNASAEAEMVMSRVSHAIAMNAILCAAPLSGVRTDPECRWTSNTAIKPEDFGFDPVPTAPARTLTIKANACIPRASRDVAASDCKPSKVDVNLEMINISRLRDSGLLGGLLGGGDNDPWGIKISTKNEYVSDKVDGDTGNLKKEIKESTAIVRRPRMFVRFEVGAGICERQCTATRSHRPGATPCVGLTEAATATGSTTNAIINVSMVNDGPGYLHRFKVKRTFVPNPEFSSDPQKVDEVYDSATTLPNGLASGESVDFQDTSTPCYIQTMYNTVEDSSLAGSSATSVAASRKISGRVYYEVYVGNTVLDPSNAIYMGTGDASIQAQERVITSYVSPPPPPPPDPCANGGCYVDYGSSSGGDGGGAGGCGAGGGDGY